MENDLLAEYQKEASRIEQDAIHSAKGYYNAAARWRQVHLWIGIPNAILAAFAGVSAFQEATVTAGCLAIVVAALAAVNTCLNPGDRSSTHQCCAGEYLCLRNRSRIFVSIVSRSGATEEIVNQRFEELASKFGRDREDCRCTP
jgi:hypothetical protein